MENFVQKSCVDKSLIDELQDTLGCGRDLAEALAIRGFRDKSSIDKFLRSDIADLTPVFAYNGMREAADRIKQAIDFGEKIVIYGDYDCDGVCATAILQMFLVSLGVDVNFYIPNRKKEGYGINRDALEYIASTYYPDLVITVDCGITAKEDIEYAINDLGIDFIVTDHHEPSDVLPDCICVNPKIDRLEGTFNELCGAGIALRLCEAVGGEKAMMYYIDLAAIATIGDIVPLCHDNRIIVNYGLQIVNSRARLCTKLLLEVAGMKADEAATATDIAFKIVPRINAIGRLSDSSKAVSMIVDSDYFFVKSLVEQADRYNAERQQFTNDLVDDCLRKLEDYDLVSNRIIVLYDEAWEAGVLGIASAKITKMFNRPTILMTSDGEVYKGSARSIEGVNIYESVLACKPFLQAFGGHAMACGVTCSKENVQAFCFAINEYARGLNENLFVPHTEYDLYRRLDEVTLDGVRELSLLEPCGMGNPRVKYDICILTPIFSRISTTKHIKCAKSPTVELVNFDGLCNLKNINASRSVHAICDFDTKVFANRLYAQGIVHELQFDWTNFDFDEEYLAIKYAYYAKYEDSCTFDIKYITQADVLGQVEDELYGVCFLAYTKSTFEKYRTLLGGKLKRCDYGTLSDCNPLNRLVLDADISQNLAYYKKIVILDTLPSLGVVDYYRLNKDAEVVMVRDNIADDYLQLVRRNFPLLDEMRSMFCEIRKLVSADGKIANFSQLAAAYKAAGGSNTIAIYLAAFVFFELKILKLNGGFFVDNTIKTSLDKSVIYGKVKELIYAGQHSN